MTPQRPRHTPQCADSKPGPYPRSKIRALFAVEPFDQPLVSVSPTIQLKYSESQPLGLGEIGLGRRTPLRSIQLPEGQLLSRRVYSGSPGDCKKDGVESLMLRIPVAPPRRGPPGKLPHSMGTLCPWIDSLKGTVMVRSPDSNLALASWGFTSWAKMKQLS